MSLKLCNYNATESSHLLNWGGKLPGKINERDHAIIVKDELCLKNIHMDIFHRF